LELAVLSEEFQHNFSPVIAAAAPATDLRQLLQRDFGTLKGKNLIAMTLWSWARVFGVPVKDVTDPAALNTCMMSPLEFGI
jgi:hypothetical protein